MQTMTSSQIDHLQKKIADMYYLVYKSKEMRILVTDQTLKISKLIFQVNYISMRNGGFILEYIINIYEKTTVSYWNNIFL